MSEIAKFQKGVSGNPGGRPKGNPEVKEILKAASPEAARVLVELLHSEKDSIRLTAAQDILDRTEGKAIQAQAINMDISGMLDVRTQVRGILLEHERKKTELQLRQDKQLSGIQEHEHKRLLVQVDGANPEAITKSRKS